MGSDLKCKKKKRQKRKVKKRKQKGRGFRQELSSDKNFYLQCAQVEGYKRQVLRAFLTLNSLCSPEFAFKSIECSLMKVIKFAGDVLKTWLFGFSPDRFLCFLQVPENNLLSSSPWRFLCLPVNSSTSKGRYRDAQLACLTVQSGLFGSNCYLNWASAPWVPERRRWTCWCRMSLWSLSLSQAGTQNIMSHQIMWFSLIRLSSPGFYCCFLKWQEIWADFPPVLTFSYCDHSSNAFKQKQSSHSNWKIYFT